MAKQPSVSNFVMPAEWEAHSAVWLAWPYDKTTFGSLNQKGNKVDFRRLTKVEREFIKLIKVLSGSEQVKLLFKDKKQHANILEKVGMLEVDYADVWTRDYLPTFVKNRGGQLAAVKWIYNGYGQKFPELVRDNDVWEKVNQTLKIQTFEPGIILESGAIESNGQGTLITTEQCLGSRNPNLSKTQVEKIFFQYLGAAKTIWLKKGLVNDHTDGHIDEIARFVAPGKIVCAYEDNPGDENYQILHNNYRALLNARDAAGNKFEVIKLPMPHMEYNSGAKAPVSYCNFYIGNKVVLASVFKDKNDASALEIIQSYFPERQVVGIDCSEIIYGGGAIHCLTQQVPAVSAREAF